MKHKDIYYPNNPRIIDLNNSFRIKSTIAKNRNYKELIPKVDEKWNQLLEVKQTILQNENILYKQLYPFKKKLIYKPIKTILESESNTRNRDNSIHGELGRISQMQFEQSLFTLNDSKV